MRTRIPDSIVWWLMVAVSCITIMSNAGCTMTGLDRAQHSMTQRSINTGLQVIEAVSIFGEGADLMATAKHDSDDKVIELTDDKFWGRHTNSSGGLVSLNAVGEEEPIRLVDVKAFIAKREISIAKRLQSEKNWGEHSNQLKITLGVFKQSLLDLRNADLTIYEKRQSIDAAANRILGLFGTAAALAIGAAGG